MSFVIIKIKTGDCTLGPTLDGSQTPDPLLILDGVKDFVNWELEWSELLYRLVGLK